MAELLTLIDSQWLWQINSEQHEFQRKSSKNIGNREKTTEFNTCDVEMNLACTAALRISARDNNCRLGADLALHCQTARASNQLNSMQREKLHNQIKMMFKLLMKMYVKCEVKRTTSKHSVRTRYKDFSIFHLLPDDQEWTQFFVVGGLHISPWLRKSDEKPPHLM